MYHIDITRARENIYEKVRKYLFIFTKKKTIKIFTFLRKIFVAPRPKVKSKKKIFRTKNEIFPTFFRIFQKCLEIFTNTKNMKFSLKNVRKRKFSEICILLEKSLKYLIEKYFALPWILHTICIMCMFRMVNREQKYYSNWLGYWVTTEIEKQQETVNTNGYKPKLRCVSSVTQKSSVFTWSMQTDWNELFSLHRLELSTQSSTPFLPFIRLLAHSVYGIFNCFFIQLYTLIFGFFA